MNDEKESEQQEHEGQDKETHREEIGGDRISVGNITDSKGVAIGREAQATVTEGIGGGELALLFAPVYRQIQDRPADSDVDKEELSETVKKIEAESARGEDANPNRVERWLKYVALMAPDIFDVVAATLLNPAAGVAAVIRKVVEKAQEQESLS
jgi:hypothetical protein